MKSLILLIALLTILFYSCKKREIDQTQEKMIGEWLEVSPCNACDTVIINMDSIFFKNQPKRAWSYEVVSKNKIEAQVINVEQFDIKFENETDYLTIKDFLLLISGIGRDDLGMERL